MGVQNHKGVKVCHDAQTRSRNQLSQLSLIFDEDVNSNTTLEWAHFINPFASDFMLENWG